MKTPTPHPGPNSGSTTPDVHRGAVREKFTLSKDVAKSILYEDSEDYKVVLDQEQGTNRWSNTHSLVIQRLSDQLFFETEYCIGTGDEGERPWEYDDEVDFRQVFPKQVVTTIYE